jgi:hypothetical protein
MVDIHIPETLSDELRDMVDVTGYVVPKLFYPNSHLHCTWVIKDKDAEEVDRATLLEHHVGPALRSLAEEINKYDVAIFQKLPTVHELLAPGELNPGMVSEVLDGPIPIRWNVQYRAFKPPTGTQFSIDVLCDLLTKPKELEK